MKQVLHNKNNIPRLITWIVLAAGIALRLAEWLHTRDLMIDEINVVRNVFERSFLQLTGPLHYEQFAPPLFLWMLKLSGLLFGYGELSMRLFPLISSCAALFLLHGILTRLGGKNANWYPLALFGFSLIYIQYGNDVKQYASDSMIALLLIYLAIDRNIFKRGKLRFFLFWSAIGASTIWASMPGVFILAGIGIRLFYNAVRERKDYMLAVAATGIVWLIAFGLYYGLLLKQQIGSSYLQSFHEQYFLNAHSLKSFSDTHNIDLLRTLFTTATGSDTTFALTVNLALFLIGGVRLFKIKVSYGLMISVPILGLLIASCLHTFTLIPRVCIFIMPVILFVVGIGLEWLFSLRPVVKWPVALVSVVCIYLAQQFTLFTSRVEIDEFTTGVAYAHERNVPYNNIYMPVLYTPTYIYYTAIHPDKKRAATYRQVQLLPTNEKLNASQIRNDIKGRSAFIYFWIDDPTMQAHRDSIFSFMKPVDSLIKPGYKTLVFDKK